MDELLRERLLERYADAARSPGLGLDEVDEASREALLSVAEGVKIQLNQHATLDANPMARVASRTLALRTEGGASLPPAVVRVTLGELARWTEELTERAVDCAEEALSRAGLGWSGLDEVLLVGGSSWLYPVQARLRALRGASAVRIFDDADDPLNPACAVAAGAALYAERCSADGGRAAADYHGVIPDALGVRAKEADPARPGARPAPYVLRQRAARDGFGHGHTCLHGVCGISSDVRTRTYWGLRPHRDAAWSGKRRG